MPCQPRAEDKAVTLSTHASRVDNRLLTSIDQIY